MLVKSVAVAAASFLITLGIDDVYSAVGVAGGVAASAVYAWGYLASHIGRLSGKEGNRKLFTQASLRLVLLIAASASVWLAGREVFLGFLVGFGIGFAVLISTEVPRIARLLRTRGLV